VIDPTVSDTILELEEPLGTNCDIYSLLMKKLLMLDSSETEKETEEKKIQPTEAVQGRKIISCFYICNILCILRTKLARRGYRKTFCYDQS